MQKKQSDAQIKKFVDAHIIPQKEAMHYIYHLWWLHKMKAMRAKDKSEKEKKKRGNMMSTTGKSGILLVAWINF